ncbi:MAG: GtrA family protein [Eubacterium sp.]|jgi:putative flippase GtrA|nr:GtrA family protein [Eubacterium sp.]
MKKLKQLFDRLMSTSIVKYGLVGVINTLITGIIIFTLMNVFSVSLRLSNAAGYVAGFINSFVLNKLWTFNAKETSTLKQFLRFTAVFAVCFLLQHSLVVVLVEKLSMDKNISTLIGMVFYTIIGYFFNKMFTFKK